MADDLRRRASRRLDLIGAALFVAAIGWTYVSSGSTDAANRVAAVFAAAAAALVVGRLIGRFGGWVVPGAIALTAAALWALDPNDIMDHHPLSGPFGYANTKGAFYMIAAGCTLAAIGISGTRRALIAGLVAAVPFMIVPFAIETGAPAGLAVAVPVIGLVTNSLLGPRRTVRVLGALVAAALLTTALLGATYDAGDQRAVDRLIDASISERRLALWKEAGTMMKENPLDGVGAGRFGALSPTALADKDARWAHSAYLQQGAEAGVPGFLLIVAIVLWAFARLSAGAEDARPVLAAIVLAAVGIHATLDYVMHFPAIPVATAAVVGSGSAFRRARRATEPSPA